MLLTLFAALSLAQAGPDPADATPPPPPAPAETPVPSAKGHKTPVVMDAQTCLTKGLSPDEKKSCCKQHPEMCS